MEDVVDVIQGIVDYVSSCNVIAGKQIDNDLEGDHRELHGKASIPYGPLKTGLDFFSLDYRRAPSLVSVPSSGGSELGDLSDSELPFLASDDDSDKEFEKLQQFTSETRYNVFKREHPDGTPTHKKLKGECRLVDDVYHEYDNLPPLDRLTIQCEESIPIVPVGHVTSIVDCLVVVQSDSGVALDFDSVLFDKDRKSIGVVFDLFGPVRSPFYSIRFNTNEEASKINIGMEVYYAPSAEQYTKVVIEANNKVLVSDDEHSLDDEPVFSDDEKEKEYRAKKMAGTTRPERLERQGHKSVMFSETTIHSNNLEAGNGRNVGRGRSWNWHNRQRGPSRRRSKRKHNSDSREESAISHSIEMHNPYSEYGCYSSIPFVDTREL